MANWSPFADNCTKLLKAIQSCYFSFFPHLLTSFSSSQEKDRALRLSALNCISRLIWVYLFRGNETDTKIITKVEPTLRILFPEGRKTVYPQDTGLDKHVEVVHFLAVKKLDYAMMHFIQPFLSIDQKNQLPENLATDRITVAVRGGLFFFLFFSPLSFFLL